MFGIGAHDDQTLIARPQREDIALLAPYEDASLDTLDALARTSKILAQEPGNLPPRWFEGHRLFLHSGQLELRMANERRVFLSSVSPPARFPLPPPHLAQIRSVGHTTFVRVPLAQDRPRATRIAADSAADPLMASLSRVLFKRLDAGDIPLPSMPDLAVKLNGALRESDSARDAHDIAKLIQLDPALATKVIHVVNSAAFGFVRKAGSVQQAVTRLGRDRIRNVAVGFLMRNAFNTRSTVLRKHANALWLRSCHVAAICFTLARQLPMLDPERAMLAGLIHQIGILPVLGLAQSNPDLFATPGVLNRAKLAFARPLGRFVIERWALGEDMLDVVENAGNWQRIGHAVPDYADIVILAQLHADLGRANASQAPRFDQVSAFRKLEFGKLTPRKSVEALGQADQEIQELRRILASTTR